MTDHARIYVSMPRPFLAELDQTAQEAHLSRSALIREAVKLYMAVHSGGSRPRFFELTEALRRGFAGMPEEELAERIDRAVARVRGRHESA